jgi:hypothetical protein
MSALGLAIMIVAGAVTLDVVLENTRNTDASVVGQTIANVDLGGFFTAGVLVGVALMLGLMLLLAGLKRANRKRLERKELARNYEGTAAQAETLQDERDRLAAELEQERAAHRNAAGTTAAPVAAATGQHSWEGGHTSGLGNEQTVGQQQVRREKVGREQQVAQPNQDAPVYPSELAGAAPGPAAGTATQERTAPQERTATQERSKPSLKARLLGR